MLDRHTLFAAALVALCLGCSGSLPKPATGPVPKSDLFVVPYPPPPAKVETVPPKKKAGDVWIDGQWDWDGRDWRWHEGVWMTPPKNAYFTRWTTVRKPDGRLYFARAAWRDQKGRTLDLYPSLEACPVPGATVATSQ